MPDTMASVLSTEELAKVLEHTLRARPQLKDGDHPF